MMMFVAGVLAMVVVGLAFLLPPLLRRAPTRVVVRDEINVDLFKGRLAELEQERDEGLLSAEQYDETRLELERDLLENTETDAPEKAGGGGRWAAVAVGVGIPLLAVFLYLQLGSPDFIEHRPGVAHSGGSGEAGDLSEVTRQLVERLKNEPDNGQGWALLARSYTMQQRYGEAVAAYGEALQRLGESPELLTDYAEVMSLQQGTMRGKPQGLVARALALDPHTPGALWLAGIAAFETQEYAAAVGYWERLLPKVQPGSDTERMLQENIAEARARLGSAAAPSSTPPAAMPAVARSARLQVTLAPALAGRVPADAILFVLAREPQGMPMPIAAIRRQAGELPLQFTLDDSATLDNARRLSSFDEVMVVARISRSGNTMPQSGDLEGKALVRLDGGDKVVSIVIDRVIP